MRRGELHVLEDLDSGGSCVISRVVQNELEPLLNKDGLVRVKRGDELPLKVLRGLKIETE